MGSKTNLIHGDCMPYMKDIPDNWFDLAVVDPPYGIGVNISMGRRKGQKKSSYHKFYGNDREPPGIEYFSEIKRLSRNQIIWGANHFIDNFGFSANSSCWIMWDKKFSFDVSFAQFELAWTSFNSTCKKFEMSPISPDRIHPTQKPIQLYTWLFNTYAQPGQRILDTHLGSASSAIAAHYFGCEFTGIEIDKEYYDAAVKRFNNETKQIAMF